MGSLGAYPPFLAAWAPFLLFFLIGEAVLVQDGGIGGRPGNCVRAARSRSTGGLALGSG